MKKQLTKEGLYGILKMMGHEEAIHELERSEQNGQLWYSASISNSYYEVKKEANRFEVVVEVGIRFDHLTPNGESVPEPTYSRKKTFRKGYVFLPPAEQEKSHSKT